MVDSVIIFFIFYIYTTASRDIH